VSLGAGQILRVDLQRHQVEDGTGTNRINDWWTSGQFFDVDGRDAARGLSGPYPTIEVSGSPADARLTYRKSWL
jgi:hypothetical protein